MSKFSRYIFISTLFIFIASAPIVAQAQKLIAQEFYENGKLKSTTYKSGKEISVISYYDNGQLKEKRVYSKFKKNGQFQTWHENGEKHISANYTGNLRDGDWVIWNHSGEVIGSATFEQGKLQSGILKDNEGNLVAYR